MLDSIFHDFSTRVNTALLEMVGVDWLAREKMADRMQVADWLWHSPWCLPRFCTEEREAQI